MKKYAILALFVMFAMSLLSRDITLTFTSTTQNGTYYPFEVVNVTNVTRGWTESLMYPDTTMILTSYDGLQESMDDEGFLSEVYPNPLSGTANVLFGMKNAGTINAKIISINGSVLSEFTGFLEEGTHRITINMQKPQLAIFVIQTNDNQYVKRVLNITYGTEDNIAINRISSEINCAKTISDGEFVIGDVMSYIAVNFVGSSMIESDRITQAQYDDDLITLVFHVNTGGMTPTVTTSLITFVTINTAFGGGNLISSGGSTVTARGVCWSTNQNPTIDDSHTNAPLNSLNLFDGPITGLEENTTYYVRAYATNNSGTAYGNQEVFTTLSSPTTGAVTGVFSVSPTRRVFFSQGNLQYQASTDIWRFAENQWNFVGGINLDTGIEYGNVYENGIKCDNSMISETYDGWIDLFGWGTSGYDHGAVCYQPWSVSLNDTAYYAYGDSAANLFDQSGMADWGYNAISNGGNTNNIWRTLTNSEWFYLARQRATQNGARYTKAKVHDVDGLLLLPHKWDLSYDLNNINESNSDYGGNIIEDEQWALLHDKGVVFLPVTLAREDTMTYNYGGKYWSSSNDFADWNVGCIAFWAGSFNPSGGTISYMGQAVRLVQDAQ